MVNQLSDRISTEQIADLALSLGESDSNIKRALNGIFPLLLGGLLKKISDTDLSSNLDGIIDLFKQAPPIDEATGNATVLMKLVKGRSRLVEKFLASILGNKVQAITLVISKYSSIKLESATALFSMAVPIMMGEVNKVLGGTFDRSQLTALLASQKDNIKSQIPSGLGTIFGLANFGVVDKKELKKALETGKSWLPKCIGIILLLLIVLFSWSFCSNRSATLNLGEGEIDPAQISNQQTMNNTTQSDSSAAEEYLVKFSVVKLPNGVELNVPASGLESKLLAFIQDDSRVVDKVSWFPFDRLLFESGSAQLTETSKEELKDIVEILQAYPIVTIKIGGYTDNTGTADVNLRVSQERADAVMNQLVALGIADSRIEAKGYGEVYPVASNDTEENRAKNRRIELLVTNK